MSSKAGIDWKAKYQQIRGKFISSVDMSYRLGYEQGLKDASVQAMQQQMQQQQQQMQQMAQMQQAPQPEQAPPQDAQGQPDQGAPQGDEVGQAIDELGNIVNKAEGELNFEELKKSYDKLKDAHNIKSISFLTNTAPNDKKVLNTQEKLVDEMLSRWSDEEKNAQSKAMEILSKLGK